MSEAIISSSAVSHNCIRQDVRTNYNWRLSCRCNWSSLPHNSEFCRGVCRVTISRGAIWFFFFFFFFSFQGWQRALLKPLGRYGTKWIQPNMILQVSVCNYLRVLGQVIRSPDEVDTIMPSYLKNICNWIHPVSSLKSLNSYHDWKSEKGRLSKDGSKELGC